MQKQQLLVGAVIAFVLGLALALWWGRSRPTPPESPAPAKSSATATLANEREPKAAGVSDALVWPGQFRLLAKQAVKGEPSAIYQLVSRLEACALQEQDRMLLSQPRQLEEQAPTPDMKRMMESVARLRAEAAERERMRPEMCAGLTAEHLEARGQWLQRLAASGDAEANLCYALFGASDDRLPPRYSDQWIQAMRSYQAQSPSAAARAAAAGLPAGLALQYEMVAPASSRLGLRVPHQQPDPERALSLALLLAKLDEQGRLPLALQAIGDWRARARVIGSGLNPESHRRAEAFASQQTARYATSRLERSEICPLANGSWL